MEYKVALNPVDADIQNSLELLDRLEKAERYCVATGDWMQATRIANKRIAEQAKLSAMRYRRNGSEEVM